MRRYLWRLAKRLAFVRHETGASLQSPLLVSFTPGSRPRSEHASLDIHERRKKYSLPRCSTNPLQTRYGIRACPSNEEGLRETSRVSRRAPAGWRRRFAQQSKGIKRRARIGGVVPLKHSTTLLLSPSTSNLATAFSHHAFPCFPHPPRRLGCGFDLDIPLLFSHCNQSSLLQGRRGVA